MNDFINTFNNSKVFLTEGGIVERLRRNPYIELDPFIVHTGMIYEKKGREILEHIYREYINIGQQYDLPFLSLAPSWRANTERIKYSKYVCHKNINQDCVDFLKEIRESYSDYSRSIFISGMMACKGDAYNANEALSKEEAIKFHRQQAEELSQSGCDLIKAATLPALSEAMGIASLLSNFDLPYVISFVIRPEGILLDGTPLHRAIEIIDSEIQPNPFFYMINCVHPENLVSALNCELKLSKSSINRILGFQGNTSTKSPEELDNLSYVDTTEPIEFAQLIIDIHKRFGLKLLGGCCGSDSRHINEIAKRLKLVVSKEN